jgi:hypothetical protein
VRISLPPGLRNPFSGENLTARASSAAFSTVPPLANIPKQVDPDPVSPQKSAPPLRRRSKIILYAAAGASFSAKKSSRKSFL